MTEINENFRPDAEAEKKPQDIQLAGGQDEIGANMMAGEEAEIPGTPSTIKKTKSNKEGQNPDAPQAGAKDDDKVSNKKKLEMGVQLAEGLAGKEDAWLKLAKNLKENGYKLTKEATRNFSFGCAAIIAMIAFLIFTIGAGFLPDSQMSQANGATTMTYPKICLDPGHPSSTSGAAGEKEINFKVATDLKAALEAKGYPVFMTKNSVGEVVDNQERANRCATAGGKYMLALHADDTGNATDFPYLIYANHKRSISAQSKSDADRVQKGLIDTLSKAGLLGADIKGKANCEENVCTAAQDLGVFVGGDKNKLSVDIIEMIHLVNGHSWLDDNGHRAKFVEGLVAGIGAAYPPTSSAPSGGGSTNGKVPFFFQGNDPITGKRSPWADKTYGSGSGCSTYAAGGCGPTSMAMIVSYFTGQNHFPDEIGTIMTQKGWRPCGSGTSYEAPTGIAKIFGLQSKVLPNTQAAADEYLAKGALIEQIHHTDWFTKGGHYIVVVAKRTDGKYDIHDSNGGNYSRTLISTASQVFSSGLVEQWAIWK